MYINAINDVWILNLVTDSQSIIAEGVKIWKGNSKHKELHATII